MPGKKKTGGRKGTKKTSPKTGKKRTARKASESQKRSSVKPDPTADPQPLSSEDGGEEDVSEELDAAEGDVSEELDATLEPDLAIDSADETDDQPLPGQAKAAKGKKTASAPIVPEVLPEEDIRKKRSLVKYDPLTAYIQEIRRYELLTRDEETELAIRYKEEGDVDAARDLVTANLRLVVKIAHEYRKAHQNLLDLIQEGNIGLMQAVRKFDPYRGVKLSTYSSWWIRAYILKFVLNNWRLVKIGTTQAQRKLFFNLRKQREELRRKGIEPKASSIATALNVSEREVVEMERRLAAPELSLSAPVGKGDSTSPRTYLDTLHDSTVSPDEEVAGAEFRELLGKNLEEFSRTLKGRDVVIYRERLMTDEPLTLKEIGDRYGITKERARQLEKRLLGKLRNFLRQQMGDAVEVALGLET